MIRLYRPPGDDGQPIKPCLNFLRVFPERLPEPAFDSVAFRGVFRDSTSDGTGEPADFPAVGQRLNKENLPPEAFPLSEQTLKIRSGKSPGSAEFFLSGGQLRDESAPALLPAALKYSPPGFFGHALAESMLVLALDVGLVCEFFLHARIVSAASDACQTNRTVLHSLSLSS